MRSASSAWVISPWANRSARIELVTLVGLLMPPATAPAGRRRASAPSRHRPQHEAEVDDVGDPEVVHLGHRHEHGRRRAGHEEPAAGVLAEPVDLLVPHVAPAAVARAGRLDQDPARDRRDDRGAGRPQQHRGVRHLGDRGARQPPQDDREVDGVGARAGHQVDPGALLFVRHRTLTRPCKRTLTRPM